MWPAGTILPFSLSVCLFLSIKVPTATNIAYEIALSLIATDTHVTYEMIPASPSSIPTASNVAYAVPLQPGCSSLQPAATSADCDLYDTVGPCDPSPVYDDIVQ